MDFSFNSLLVEYYSLFFPLEASERLSLESDLEKFQGSEETCKEDKLKFLATLFDQKIREEAKKSKITSSETEEEIDHVDPILLGEAMERFKRKLHFSANFSLSRPKLKVTFGLQRSTDSFDVSSQLDSSYNLTKIQEEKEDFVQEILEGEHRSLLQFQSETIGHSVDSFFLNVFAA